MPQKKDRKKTVYRNVVKCPFDDKPMKWLETLKVWQCPQCGRLYRVVEV